MRSFIIAVQVCHYFNNYDRNGLNAQENIYIDANIQENCRIKDRDQDRLTNKYANDAFVSKVIADILSNPGAPDGN